MSNQNRLTRREFIKDAAIASAALAASGIVSAAPAAADSIPDKWDKEADVVVVGFGGAGAMAAFNAHDAGAQVLILEKTPTPGGCTTLCGGYILAAGTSIQKAAGITDTPDEMYKYWLAMGKGLSDPDLVRIIVDQAADVVEWLIKRGTVFPLSTLVYSGAEQDPEFAAITPSKKRGHIAQALKRDEIKWPFPPATEHTPPDNPPTGGSALFKALWDSLIERKIEYLLETRAQELVADPVKKEVLGVKAVSKGQTLFIKAKRAVVLATGGFSMNKEMAKFYCPDALLANYANSSDTGDGHKMGMALGAELVNMNQSSIAPGIVGVYKPLPTGCIMVSFGGRRFYDETCYRAPAEVINGYLGKPIFAIFDDDIQKVAKVADPVQAPTIAELAAKIGINPTVLDNTVEAYNGYVKGGKDLEFGRTKMVAIEKAPFYAVKVIRPVTSSVTHGGLRINTKTQVIDVFGKIIPRLYAAGRVSGGSLGEMYPASGSAIVDAFVFGRIAGVNGAAEKPWDVKA